MPELANPDTKSEKNSSTRRRGGSRTRTGGLRFTPAEFSALIARGKQGDPQAIAVLYRRFRWKVLRTVRLECVDLLRRRYDTVDLGHSVFVDLLSELPDFEDQGEDKFRGWLFAKARNKVRLRLRRQYDRDGNRREKSLWGKDLAKVEAVYPTPFAALAEDEETQRLRDELNRLDPDSREIMVLYHEERRSFAEIAARLGLPSEDAARKRYVRALAALRKRWKPS